MKSILCLLLLLSSLSFYSQVREDIVLTDYIRDVQKWEKVDDKMSLSFWLPTSYWRVALQSSPDVPKETIDYFESILKDYTVICALDLKIGLTGDFYFTEEKYLRESIHIEDNKSKKYYPLKDKDISADALVISETIKPMFNQMLGKMGKGMNFYFFKIHDKEGNKTINEFNEGSFKVIHSNMTFEYSLPIPSLLPPKKCPVDSELMNGTWKFCPIHGDKLTDQ